MMVDRSVIVDMVLGSLRAMRRSLMLAGWYVILKKSDGGREGGVLGRMESKPARSTCYSRASMLEDDSSFRKRDRHIVQISNSLAMPASTSRTKIVFENQSSIAYRDSDMLHQTNHFLLHRSKLSDIIVLEGLLYLQVTKVTFWIKKAMSRIPTRESCVHESHFLLHEITKSHVRLVPIHSVSSRWSQKEDNSSHRNEEQLPTCNGLERLECV